MAGIVGQRLMDRPLDEDFGMEEPSDDDMPDDEDEGEGGDSFHSEDNETYAEEDDDQLRALNELLRSPRPNECEGHLRSWEANDYGQPLKTALEAQMDAKSDFDLKWGAGPCLDSVSSKPGASSEAASLDVYPFGGSAEEKDDAAVTSPLDDLLRDWDAKARSTRGSVASASDITPAVSSASVPACGTGIAGVRAQQRFDAAPVAAAVGSSSSSSNGMSWVTPASAAYPVCTAATPLQGAIDRAAAAKAAPQVSNDSIARMQQAAATMDTVPTKTSPPQTHTAEGSAGETDELVTPVPPEMVDDLLNVGVVAGLLIQAVCTLAIKPVQPNTIRYYLCKSAFPKFRGDTIRFSGVGEDVSEAPQLLTSKYNSPKLVYFKVHKAVRHSCLLGAMRRAGLKETKRAHWNVCWGKRLKDEDYLSLNPFQKVNHFPGTWHIGRKDMLIRGVLRARRNFGDGFDIIPQTFLFPHDAPLLAAEMARTPGAVYIVKPPASSCGRGIYLINSASDIPHSENCLVQRYIPNPLTIGGYKCDLRLYAAVTSFDPLRIYLFKDGLVRFATEKLKKGESHLSNRFMHLTNYSVNKKSDKYQRNAAAKEDDRGSKWSVQALKRYFVARGHDWEKIWWRIKDVVVKTFLTCESPVASKIGMYVKNRNSCFELYGFDILLTSNMNPYLLEVNIMPALSCSSPLDRQIKSSVVSNLLNLVGVQPYDRHLYTKSEELRKKARLLGFSSQQLIESGKAALDGRSAQNNIPAQCLWTRKREAREKDANGAAPPSRSGDRPPGRRGNAGGANSGPVFPPIDFADLGTTEMDIIRDTEDEYSRRGGFERIFPTRMTGMLYGDYFEARRYCNELLCQWEIDKARFSERNRSQLLFWLQGKCPYPAHLRNEGVASVRSHSQPVPPSRGRGGREDTPGRPSASRDGSRPRLSSPPPSRGSKKRHGDAAEAAPDATERDTASRRGTRGRPPSRAPASGSTTEAAAAPSHRRAASRGRSQGRSRSTPRPPARADTPPMVKTVPAPSTVSSPTPPAHVAAERSSAAVVHGRPATRGRLGALSEPPPKAAAQPLEGAVRGISFPKMMTM
eukprot:TRINITY_DN19456_c0_g1_i1.p1 TRINITY_DN19456_c0_g1~~TRINITY_DN19456_c0_g1_i1.p1  ORF type:complete len:1080 (+),score=296.37 TRINITY_DN19456_c0_g1_i1:54-3293(+)